MDQHLENKVCLITGATNGIGEESAKELNKMGAEIIFIARSEEKGNKLKEQLLKDSGREATMIIADLSSQDQVKKAAEKCLALPSVQSCEPLGSAVPASRLCMQGSHRSVNILLGSCLLESCNLLRNVFP